MSGELIPAEVTTHNAEELQILQLGDLVEFKRDKFSHWGVYAGHGKVIHVGKLSLGRGRVMEQGALEVAETSKMYRNNQKDEKLSPVGSKSEIVARAKSRIGYTFYNIFVANCEHFASWCRYKVGWSDQVEAAVKKTTLRGIVFASSVSSCSLSASDASSKEFSHRHDN